MDGSAPASHSLPPRAIAGRGTTEEGWSKEPHVARLRSGDVAAWAKRYHRIWLISPHPDDEVLGLGACMVQLSALHADLRIVSVTDGAASHKNSKRWTADRLALARPAELRRALETLKVDAEVLQVGLPDGHIDAYQDELVAFLIARVTEKDLILTTWRFDGHPDHETCGHAAALAARRTGATLGEYPVWMWHWAATTEPLIPWARAYRLPVDAGEMARKREAIKQFVSQVTPDARREAVLPPHVIARFTRPYELVFI